MEQSSCGNAGVRRKVQKRNLGWERGNSCEKEWREDEEDYVVLLFLLKVLGTFMKRMVVLRIKSKDGKKGLGRR